MKTMNKSRDYLDALKKSYPTVYKACIKQMSENKGKRRRSFEVIPFYTVMKVLKSGVPEKVVVAFLNKERLLEQLKDNYNEKLLSDERIVKRLLELEDNYKIANTYYWLTRNLDCTEDIIFSTLSRCAIHPDIIDDIHILNMSDFQHIQEVHTKYKDLAGKKYYLYADAITLHIVAYIAFKKNNLNTRYLDDTMSLLKIDYMDMYIHVAKHYGDRFVEIIELMNTNKDTFDFQSATLTFTCPGLFKGDSFRTQKMNYAHMLAIIELHYQRTGEVMSTETIMKYEKLIRREIYDPYMRFTDYELTLVNFITQGEGILAYDNLGLSNDEIMNILESSEDYALAFEECKKYTLISLKSPDLLNFRERLIKRGKVKQTVSR